VKRTATVAVVLAGLAATAAAQSLGTAFTYQGRFTDAGNPASGSYDLQLVLFDAASGGAQVGPTLTRDDVAVANGLFTVSLDFGAVFAGNKRWLEIRVRPGASTGTYTTLGGLQELSPSPNAVFSANSPWTGISGKPAGFADDIDNDSGGDITGVTAGTGLTGGGTAGAVSVAVDPVATQTRVSGTCAAGSSVRGINQDGTVVCETDDDALGALSCANGQIAKRTGSAWACADDPPAWGLTGNAGTTGTNFIGTTDNVPFEIRTNNERALRFERRTVSLGPGSQAISSNVIAGHPSNVVAANVTMATIAGGGGSQTGPVLSLHNEVLGVGGTVGGGGSNSAGAGGGFWPTIAGGLANRAEASYSSVGGGNDNQANGFYSTVPGGARNRAGGSYSLAAGYRARVRRYTEVGGGDGDGDEGTFAWADSAEADFVSTGPNQFLIRSAGGVGINTNAPVPGALTIAPPGKLTFGTQTRQLIDLWGGGQYGIGVQGGVLYFRTEPPGGMYAWFLGGTHSDTQNDPGPGGIRQMRLDGAGNLFVRGGVSPGGADFAEMLPGEHGLEAGDVLAIGPDGQLTLSTTPYQASLAGVYSTKPGLVGGAVDGESTEGKVPLAVSGVVPVKVTDEGGPIGAGDALTSSSTPGHAMKAAMVRVNGIAFFPSGVVIGKALEPLHSATGVIRALVVLQ
jgi:hypothetical protein